MASFVAICELCVSWIVVIFIMSFPNCGVSLDVIAKPSLQSSTAAPDVGPEKAVDGDIHTISHTVYKSAAQKVDPWWRLDLEAVYCLRKVTIVNRLDSNFDLRLDGARVRAGLNGDRVSNTQIGAVDISVSDSQRVLTFVADPIVSARYVSVDLPGSNRILHMGEVMVEEFFDGAALASTAIPLDGALASQSSSFSYTGGAPWAADHAVDIVFRTPYDNPYCSQTGYELNPWWKIDLTSEQCVQRIVLKSRDATYLDGRYRFEGAIVRAGLSGEPTENTMCGSPVTRYEAVANNWMEFDCNPPDGLTARYVSVDIPRTTYLPVCEIFVLPCDLPVVDFTFVATPALVYPTGGSDVVLSAYKGPNDIPAGVNLGRQLATGGMTGLPSGASEEDDPSLNCTGRSLRLPAEGGTERVGVFYFEATRRSTNTRIQVVLLQDDGSTVHIRPVQRTQTANIGDSIRLEMQNVAAPNTNYRWKHNGDNMPSWNGQLSVSIDAVAMSDGGVYSCFVSGQEDQQLHGIMRLIVRECPEGMWGPPSCQNTCRRCYNGGICHADTGSCTCAPGFKGQNCEQVMGRNVFGQNGRHSCSNTADPHDDACRGRLFCLPDPYGCSCAAGFMGLDCMQECTEGMYGADCKQTCRCALGETCSKDTGECSNGVCAATFYGINCQCSRQEASPDNVTPTSVNQHSLTFAWSQPPNCGFQGGAVTGYLYKLTHGSSGATFRQSNTSLTVVTVDGLVPYTEYGFHVAATTSTGSGPFSESFTVRTLEAEPTAPLNVGIRSAEQDSLTVEWMAPDPPHGNITNYDVAFWVTGNVTTRMQHDDIGTVSLSYQISNLKVNVTYSIQVRAKTSVGAGPWSDAITETIVGVPGAIQNLRLSAATEVSLTLDWDPPQNLNGPSVTYVVEYKTVEKPYQPGFTAEDGYVPAEAARAPFTRDGLEPGTKYELRVLAKNPRFTGNPRSLLAYTLAKRDPPAPGTPTMRDDGSTETSVTINLASALPQSDTYIETYVVEVKRSSKVTRRDVLIPRHFEASPDDYIAAEIPKGTVSDTFVVGDAEMYGSYYNAPLQANGVYGIRVGSVSRGNDTEAAVTFSEPLTVSVSSQGGQGGNSSAGLAGGMIALVLVLIIVVVGLGIFYKRRTKPTKHGIKNNGALAPADRQLEQNIRVDNPGENANTYMNLGDLRASSSPEALHTPAPQTTRQHASQPGTPHLPTTQPHAKRPETTPLETTRQETQPEASPIQKHTFNEPPPVPINELADYIAEKESLGEKGFRVDFKTLPDGQLHPWTVARKPENKQKNRFANVIAYDHSRVVLTPVDDVPHSDYYNACYIDGYRETDKYIASQGPNKASLKDFWRMAWQTKVDKIVMLTSPVENAKVKCLQYWPDTGASTFTDTTVKLIEEQVLLDYTIRELKITKIDNDDESRLVKQFHYTTWPDMKPPKYPAPLLNFMRVVNAEHNKGRTLIHCSAGVGRTGTYICLDSMLEQMKQEGQVNVLGFIYQMRQKRIMMVQTPEQYHFIFDALLAASQTGETTYDTSTFRRQLTALKKESDSEETGLEKQFKVLSKVRVNRNNESAKAGKLPENEDKNRFPDFIPADRARPFLMTPTKDDDTNYINASYVPGYRKKDRYISTQMPLPNTAADIWRLVYDQKATCIVMLNPMDEDDKSMCRYWPEEGPVEFGPLVVELLQTTKNKGVTVNTFSLVNKKAKSEQARTVYQFQILDWPSDQEVPSSRQGILTLMELTQKWHEENPPIVVHCLDGLGRTSVYCTLMAMQEQFQEEKVVDVFQAVLRLRVVHRSMMYSLDHYAMCYDVFQANMDSSTIYENL